MNADPLADPRRTAGRAALRARGARWGYCQNVHPSETLDELIDSIACWSGPVRALVGGDEPLEVELRIGAAGVRELASQAGRERLATALEAAGLRVFSANGFPLSPFGAGQVKERVYRPDWTEPARELLTLELARALVACCPPRPGEPLTISTVGGMFRPRGAGPSVERTMVAALRRTARALARLADERGVRVVLCLEPEPFTTLETTPQAIGFFRALFDAPDAELLRRHLALNLDICHQAVVFESLPASLDALEAAGVPVAKVHVSAALRIPSPDAAALAALAAYDEPRYLHQTFARRADGRVDRYRDLDRLLADPGQPEELRVHFHVPLHAAPAPPLASTARDVIEALRWLLARERLPHIGLETYTWGVLADRGLVAAEPDLATGLAREQAWFEAQVGALVGA